MKDETNFFILHPSSFILHTFLVIIYPGENGYWVAECPSLPACISQGKTKEKAIANITEAIELHIEILREENRPIW